MKTFIYHHPDLDDIAVVKAETEEEADQKLRAHMRSLGDEDDFFNYEPELQELVDQDVQLMSW